MGNSQRFSEKQPSREQDEEEVLEREEIVELFRTLLQRYRYSIDPLPESAPDVARAYELRGKWIRQQRRAAKQQGTPAAAIHAKFSILTSLVDAGYDDHFYIDDYLLPELEGLEELARAAGDELLARRIGRRIVQLDTDELA
ncbi:MAG TPA: hypothetical protein VMT96_00060 [Candidatus Bathyarchaeia archaeon]|nr:hypothetical protein [Candidatus Bathyarchaeia archaeon]